MNKDKKFTDSATLSLTFDNTESAISQALGVDGDKLNRLKSQLIDKMTQLDDWDNLNNLFALTKTEILQNYLHSSEFASLKLPLKTANDFFALGYVFFEIVFATNAIQSMEQSADAFAEGGSRPKLKVARA